MDLETLQSALNDFKQALELLAIRIDALEERAGASEELVKELEKNIFENLYEPAEKALNDFKANEEFEKFAGAHSEKFAPYLESIRIVEDDKEFDPVRATYDNIQGRRANGEEINEDEFVDNVIGGIKEELQKLKNELGAVEIEVKQDENGETEIVATDEEGNQEVVATDEGGEGDGETAVEDELIAEYGDKPLPRFY